MIMRGKVDTANTPPMCKAEPVSCPTMMTSATVEIDVPMLERA